MEQLYLNTWFIDFPNLRYVLSKEDKEILNNIDPKDYADLNITKESEVIRIINNHKPQAWKWIRLYPSLKDLPAEDLVILDHIIPSDYIGEITEEDVRRIIAYRKEMARKKKEEEKADEARTYYKAHAKEIAHEEKIRTRLAKTVKWFSIFGVGLLTSGIRFWGTEIDPMPYLTSGALATVLPWYICSLILKGIDGNSVAPRSPKTDDKVGFSTAIFVVFFYIGIIGLGILLGCLITWERAGWPVAEPLFWIGISSIVGSSILFILLSLFTTHNE